MAEEPKKISFGFSKINKKAVVSLPKKEEKEIQFISCLEENSIKLLNGEEKEKDLPIIPLRNGNLLRDNMIEALKARKEKKIPVSGNEDNVKTENGKDNAETKPLTLDELAAKEILEDLKKVNETEEVQETLTIPQVEAVTVSEKESTLEDYDNMPVNQFGLAVLRGMGWKPDKGVGKNAKIVEPINPVLRPKGMGLGADKVIQPVKTESKEELVMKKGAFLKVISGQNKGLYGKVEGFNDLPGRIIVRLALQNDVVSISENLVVLVPSSEYNKNSKILNLKGYNDFVDKKPLPTSSETKEKVIEREFKSDISSANNRKLKQEPRYRDLKKNDSSEDERASKPDRKNIDSYKSRNFKKHDSSDDDRKSKRDDRNRDFKKRDGSEDERLSKPDRKNFDSYKYRDYKKHESPDDDRKSKRDHKSRDFKKHDSSEDDRKSKRNHKNFDTYRSRSSKKSDDFSETKYRHSKHTYSKCSSSESDSDRTRQKSVKYKAKRSTKYDKVSSDSESSDSDSSYDKKKSKTHRKHSSKHRSRSPSRAHKKKKKRNHRSRS